MATAESTAVETKAPEAAPETATIGGKKKTDKTGNLILDIAHEVENLSKIQALNQAEKLAENVEVTYFKLGGVLKLINQNSWFEGFESFDDFVFEKYGFKRRKADYLIMIFTELVTKQIPWEKVSGLGWTKLKDLAPKLTLENVDEWVAKAEKASVAELQAMLKAETPTDEGDKNVKTTADVVTVKFKLHQNQADILTQALSKAKGELKTDYDAVAIEGIAAGYVGGTSAVAAPTDLDTFIKSYDFETLMTRIGEIYNDDYNITVEPIEK